MTSVYDRIACAYRDIAESPFVKDGQVQGRGGYRYITIAQMLKVVRQAHAKHGIIVLIGQPQFDAEQGEKRYSVEKKTDYGPTRWFYANGHCDIRICGGSNEDCISITVPCEAMDNSDKLTNKLVTNAMRNLYRTLYAIDEGTEDEPTVMNADETPTFEEVRKRIAEKSTDPFFDTGGWKPKEVPK